MKTFILYENILDEKTCKACKLLCNCPPKQRVTLYRRCLLYCIKIYYFIVYCIVNNLGGIEAWVRNDCIHMCIGGGGRGGGGGITIFIIGILF